MPPLCVSWIGPGKLTNLANEPVDHPGGSLLSVGRTANLTGGCDLAVPIRSPPTSTSMSPSRIAASVTRQSSSFPVAPISRTPSSRASASVRAESLDRLPSSNSDAIPPMTASRGPVRHDLWDLEGATGERPPSVDGVDGVDMGLVIAHVLHSVSTTNGRIPLTIARFGPTLPLATTTKPRRRRRLISLVTARIVRPAYSSGIRRLASTFVNHRRSWPRLRARSRCRLAVGKCSIWQTSRPPTPATSVAPVAGEAA